MVKGHSGIHISVPSIHLSIGTPGLSHYGATPPKLHAPKPPSHPPVPYPPYHPPKHPGGEHGDGIKVIYNFHRGGGDTTIIRGGSAHYYFYEQPQGYVDGLAVEVSGDSAWRRIRALCIDDRGAAHPASRLDPVVRVAADYSGELYRCVIGTRMTVLVAAGEDDDFDGAATFTCVKGEALRRDEEGALFCAPQDEQRQCFERSLLRKHGPGDKLVMVVEAGGRAYSAVTTGSMSLDGGVGARPW